MKSNKLGMTLIEILMVVGILGILVGICIPKFSGSKEKSRDILRKSQINEIGAAITSYGIDHGGYPASTGTCISSLTGLIEGGYLTKIDPDPNGEKIYTYCQSGIENICPDGYYNYVSSGNRFLLAAYMEDDKNGNYRCSYTNNCNGDNDVDTEHLCQDLAELGSGGDLTKFLSANKLNDGIPSHIYVYLHL